MSVPAGPVYSVVARAAAHTAFRDVLDGHVTLAGSIRIRDAAGVLLAQVPLTRPCGTVDAGTGQLTLTPDGRDEEADANGTAAYGELCDGAGVVHLAMPCAEGSAAVSGFVVMNSLTVLMGGPVAVLSAVVG